MALKKSKQKTYLRQLLVVVALNMLNANLLLPFSFLLQQNCPNPNRVIGVHTQGSTSKGGQGAKAKAKKQHLCKYRASLFITL